jgi:hypothetical protein
MFASFAGQPTPSPFSWSGLGMIWSISFVKNDGRIRESERDQQLDAQCGLRLDVVAVNLYRYSGECCNLLHPEPMQPSWQRGEDRQGYRRTIHGVSQRALWESQERGRDLEVECPRRHN